MSARKLTAEQALHEALLALGSARPGERMTSADFGTLAAGGGCWWFVNLGRSLGNNERTTDTERERAAEQKRLIETWRREFYPDPTPADLAQPEAT